METSLHSKIYTELKQGIENGKFKYGDVMPTEIELQNMYGVSRSPVRQALTRLESEFYIEKKQGKGTFVKYSLGRGPWYAIGGLGEDYKRDWEKQKSVTISVDYVNRMDYPETAAYFGGEKKLIKIERMRLVDSNPVYYMNQFVSAQCDIERIRSAKNFLTIRELLYMLFDISVCRVDEEVSAVLPSSKLASVLQIDSSHPLLEVRIAAYASDGSTAYFDRDFVNSDYWKYRSHGNGFNKP